MFSITLIETFFISFSYKIQNNRPNILRDSKHDTYLTFYSKLFAQRNKYTRISIFHPHSLRNLESNGPNQVTVINPPLHIGCSFANVVIRLITYTYLHPRRGKTTAAQRQSFPTQALALQRNNTRRERACAFQHSREPSCRTSGQADWKPAGQFRAHPYDTLIGARLRFRQSAEPHPASPC